VGDGTHVTPTFVSTCIWNATGTADVKSVTLYLQTATAYDGDKQLAGQMSALSKRTTVQPAGVGDDSYFFVAGDQVGLLVRKGSASFKVAVYARLPVDRKEAMELTLAREVLTGL